MRRPSLREQIPCLSAPQLAALRRVARAGERLPVRALPPEMTKSLLEARAVSVNRRWGVGELRLTHLGVLALVQSQTANQVPTLASLAAGKGKGFVAERDSLVAAFASATVGTNSVQHKSAIMRRNIPASAHADII